MVVGGIIFYIIVSQFIWVYYGRKAAKVQKEYSPEIYISVNRHLFIFGWLVWFLPVADYYNIPSPFTLLYNVYVNFLDLIYGKDVE